MFGGIREVVKGEGGGGEIRHTKGRTRRRRPQKGAAEE
jgi:hypothetical protein